MTRTSVVVATLVVACLAGVCTSAPIESSDSTQRQSPADEIERIVVGAEEVGDIPDSTWSTFGTILLVGGLVVLGFAVYGAVV